MRRSIDLFILVYTSLATLVCTSLFVLGEVRIDAYIAINVLMYFISYAIVRPITEVPLLIRMLNLILLLIFAIIVVMRVYEVVFK